MRDAAGPAAPVLTDAERQMLSERPTWQRMRKQLLHRARRMRPQQTGRAQWAQRGALLWFSALASAGPSPVYLDCVLDLSGPAICYQRWTFPELLLSEGGYVSDAKYTAAPWTFQDIWALGPCFQIMRVGHCE